MKLSEEWVTCCLCKHHIAKQELTQDRIDVDIVHRCLEVDDYYYLDEDYAKKGCEHFQLHPELKDTAYFQMELLKESMRVLLFETPFLYIFIIFILGLIIIGLVIP